MSKEFITKNPKQKTKEKKKNDKISKNSCHLQHFTQNHLTVKLNRRRKQRERERQRERIERKIIAYKFML